MPRSGTAGWRLNPDLAGLQDAQHHPLQGAGHGKLAEAPWILFLCGSGVHPPGNGGKREQLPSACWFLGRLRVVLPPGLGSPPAKLEAAAPFVSLGRPPVATARNRTVLGALAWPATGVPGPYCPGESVHRDPSHESLAEGTRDTTRAVLTRYGSPQPGASTTPCLRGTRSADSPL